MFSVKYSKCNKTHADRIWFLCVLPGPPKQCFGAQGRTPKYSKCI